MVYFKLENFFKFLKKYFSIVGFLLLVMLCLFMIFANSNSVKAETQFYGVDGSAFSSREILYVVDYYNNNKSSSYKYFSFSVRPR